MFLVTESVTKVAQIYCYILGYFKNITFQVKTAVDTFLYHVSEIFGNF